MQNIMSMMEQMQVYMPMIQQFMSSISEDNINSENKNMGKSEVDGNNMMNMLKNMMSEEQQAMFSMFMNENI